MTNSENTFTGEFAYSIDTKGRVNIPAKFRASLSVDNDRTFVITKGLDPCVYAYPLSIWQQQIESALRSLSSLSMVNRHFIRGIVRYASTVTYDKQGRIQLTPILIEHAQLEKDVLIIGMVNKIEIWNPQQLQAFEARAEELDQNDYNALAEKITL
ncbi:MAG: division/cell wall cluster transcriptional repressor MraZ [Fidelibacterota bacterium]